MSTTPQKPPVPTMTTASLTTPPPEPQPVFVNGRYVDPRALPPEMAEDIVAKPLGGAKLEDLPLKNSTMVGRWIFKDPRRFTQALAQGWQVTKAQDVRPGYMSPYTAEGGTKFVNGDLIHMHISKSIYYGALKYKHQVAAALADASVAKQVSKMQAQGALGDNVHALNARLNHIGKRPAMEVFAPGASDLPGVMSDASVAGKELGRLGGSRDTGSLVDLAAKVAAGESK